MSIVPPRFKVRPEIRRAHHLSECSTNSDLPLHFTNSAYLKDPSESGDSTDSTSQIVTPSRLERLQMDGLCQNTYENISIAGNLDNFEERSDSNSFKGSRRTCSWRTAVPILLCLMSIISLLLSLLMFSKCGCYHSREGTSSKQNSDVIQMHSGYPRQEGFATIQDSVHNMSEKIKIQFHQFNKLNDDFSKLEERFNSTVQKYNQLDKQNKQLQGRIEFLENMKSQVDAKIHNLETKLNRSSVEASKRTSNVGMQINTITTKLTNSTELLKTTVKKWQDIMNNTTDEVLIKINNVKSFFWETLNSTATHLNHLVANVTKEFGEYYNDINNKFAVQEDKINNLTTLHQKSQKDLEENQTRIAEDVSKMGRAVQVFMMKLNETNEDLNNTKSTLRREMQTIRTDVFNKIQNVRKMGSPRGPIGFNGSRGPPGLQGFQGAPGPPGFNGSSSTGAKFGMCQYKNKSAKSSYGPLAKAYVVLLEPKDKKVVGATCSTDCAKEYHFEKLYKKGQNAYKCICRGESLLFSIAPTPAQVTCTIHYWECPIGRRVT